MGCSKSRPTLIPHIPTNHKWRWIVVNSSGGKDSQTALRAVVRACDRVKIPRRHIVVSHQDLGRMEWPGTRDLAYQQAQHYGLRFEVSRYRNREMEEMDLLAYVRKRGKWPDNSNRYCTSDFKRGPGGRVITRLWRESEGPILNVFGFRSEESPARKKKPALVKNTRYSTKSRDVWDWLPIHSWDEKTVWKDIRASGVPYHYAYDRGMPRLSCCFCIFAPRGALMVAGKENPGLLEEYVQLENEIGHTFQHNKPLKAIQDALRRGEEPEQTDGAWNM